MSRSGAELATRIGFFVGGQVIHDDMQDFSRGCTSRYLVHEGQKIFAGLGKCWQLMWH